MKRLQGKKALVTGSSRGIGKAIALQLALEGAEVVIHYRENEKEAQQVTEEIAGFGGRSHILQADLNQIDQAINLGRNAWEVLNGIDFLVNNAGVSYKKHFLDITREDVDHFTNINFKGTLFLTQAVAKLMVVKQTEGSIYTVTSINAIQPGIGLSVYGATKAALETLMKGVALELAPHQIKVNTIAVGAIQTEMNAAVWQDQEKLEMVNKHVPLGRLGRPQEVAVMIADLLASGSYMTGTTIKIDGGWQLQQGFTKSQPYNVS